MILRREVDDARLEMLAVAGFDHRQLRMGRKDVDEKRSDGRATMKRDADGCVKAPGSPESSDLTAGMPP
jgi:hypothetical protein